MIQPKCIGKLSLSRKSILIGLGKYCNTKYISVEPSREVSDGIIQSTKRDYSIANMSNAILTCTRNFISNA